MRALVAFTSSHGSTERIAGQVVRQLEDAGVDVRAADLLDDPGQSIGDAEAVIVGGSIHRGRHDPQLIAWVKANAQRLNELPSAFFSVSLTEAENDPARREPTREWIADLERETGWKPDLEQSFAGTLSYREYGPMLRLMMRALMRRGGHPTDSSRDYSYTDWGAVERFAREFAGRLGERG